MDNKSTTNIIALAKEKVKTEFEKLPNSLDRKEKAVSSYVHNVISDACDQDERFAEVVYKFKRTLADCLKSAMKGVGSSISDIDVYRSAIQFYFPNSEIHATVSIEITGEAPSEKEINKEPAPEKKEKKAKPNSEKVEPKKVEKPVKAKKPEKQKPDDSMIQLTLF